MKYIDAEKLIAEIERRKKQDVTFRERSILIDIETAITSLQQEQPEDSIGKFVFPKFLYARTADNKTIDVSYVPQSMDAIEYVRNNSAEEHPEVELEKFTEKIKTFQGRYKHPVSTSIKGAMAFMARMFYQYPNVARQWYDNLPKATMD